MLCALVVLLQIEAFSSYKLEALYSIVIENLVLFEKCKGLATCEGLEQGLRGMELLRYLIWKP